MYELRLCSLFPKKICSKAIKHLLARKEIPISSVSAATDRAHGPSLNMHGCSETGVEGLNLSQDAMPR